MAEEKHGFSREMRGYNRQEVDEYIAKLEKDIEFLKHENTRINAKLAAAAPGKDLMDRARSKYDSIIDEAHERAAKITAAANKNCEKKLQEFANKIAAQKKTLIELKNVARNYKSELYKKYSEQIARLDELVPLIDFEPYESNKQTVDSVIEKIKIDIVSEYNINSSGNLPPVTTGNINKAPVEKDKKATTNEFVSTKPFKTIFSNENKT